MSRDVGGIGCIGWGSLLWDPRTLPMRSVFRDDGPVLPIEFSRVSQDGRVTLVIDPEASEITTYWCELDVDTLEDAIEALRVREKIAPARVADWIGVAMRPPSEAEPEFAGARTPPELRRTIDEWLEASGLSVVIWTGLPARAPDGDFRRPSLAELVAHIESLEGPARVRAEEYIRRAPDAVETIRRAAFEARFEGCVAEDCEAEGATNV